MTACPRCRGKGYLSDYIDDDKPAGAVDCDQCRGTGTVPTELEQKVRAARDMIAALCKRRDEAGKREWIMSIPARPDHDPDLVIAAALDAQAAEIKRLRGEGEEMVQALRAAEEWLSGWASAEPYIDVIRDAIAKATTGRPWIKAAPIVPRTIAG